MWLVYLQCPSQKIRIPYIAFHERAPPDVTAVSRGKIVIDDRFEAGRSKEFAGVAADKSGTSRYEYTPATHAACSAKATADPLCILLVSNTTCVLLRALSFLMMCRICTLTVLSHMPSS